MTMKELPAVRGRCESALLHKVHCMHCLYYLYWYAWIVGKTARRVGVGDAWVKTNVYHWLKIFSRKGSY